MQTDVGQQTLEAVDADENRREVEVKAGKPKIVGQDALHVHADRNMSYIPPIENHKEPILTRAGDIAFTFGGHGCMRSTFQR